MTSFRRMSLVPEVGLKKPEDVRILKYSELDQRMNNILNSNMTDHEKMREYQETLSNYLSYHNKLKQPNIPAPQQLLTNPQLHDKPAISNATNESSATPISLPQPRIGRMRRKRRRLVSPYSKTINHKLAKVRRNLFSDSDEEELEDKKALAKRKFKWISMTR